MRFIKDKNKIYFDNAKMGPIYKELYDWKISYEKKLYEKKSNLREGYQVFFFELKELIKKFFCAEESDVLLSNSFTSAFQKILINIKDDLKFLCVKNDYPSIAQSIKNLKFKLEEIEYSNNIEEELIKSLIKYKPNILVISIVQYIDGLKLNLDFIKELKKNNKNLLIIGDGTQYCGTEKFNFDESGFDIIISSGYKWLHAGYGNAIALIKKSCFSSKSLKNDRLIVHNMFDGGHLDLYSFGSLKFSLSIIEKEINLISTKIKFLTKKMIEGLKKRKLLSDVKNKRLVHSSIFNIDDEDGKLQSFLSKNNIIASRRGNGCRISLAYYNTENEIQLFFNLLDSFYHSTLNIETPESELLP
jgi:selenocysteine lyase/cysteine desulfurase